MEIFTKENIMKENHMAKGYSIGSMEKFMMENGLKELKKGMEFGKE
jgi:hypothetical protein